MIELDVSEETPKPTVPKKRKVYSAYYDSEWGNPHPMIRFGGKYLKRLGFSVGDRIEVEFEVGRILITKPSNGNRSTE